MDREKLLWFVVGQGDGRYSRQWDLFGLGGFQFGENGIGVVGNFDFVLGLYDVVVGGNQEGVVFDVMYLFVVYVFYFDYVEGVVQCFVVIVDQWEVEVLFGIEVVV